jgi:hypothetical protein
LIGSDVDLYKEVRCGLAHAYLIETSGNARIDMGNAELHDIDYDKTSKKYIFWVRTYFDEFKAAVNRYINGLENGTENLQSLEHSLNDRPETGLRRLAGLIIPSLYLIPVRNTIRSKD